MKLKFSLAVSRSIITSHKNQRPVVMLIVFEFFATHPTPMIIAACAMHVITTHCFFYRDFTIRALMSSEFVGPIFIEVVLKLVARLFIVP